MYQNSCYYCPIHKMLMKNCNETKKKQKKKIHLLPSCVCEIFKDKFMAAIRSREIVCRSKMLTCHKYLH